MSNKVLTIAHNGQKPWHQSGFNLIPNESIESWIEKSGFNFDICESPVHFNTMPENKDSLYQAYQDKKVLYRSDTGTPLSVVSDRYNVVQPREVLEFYRDLTEVSGYVLESAGVIKSGRKLWALARLPEEAVLKGKDRVKSYLLFGTACDGSLATTITPTSLRVVCSNTLSFALNGAAEAIKIPHSTQFDAQAVKKQLGIAVSGFNNFMYQMKQLSERKVTSQESQDFFEQAFNMENQPAELMRNDRAIKMVQSLFNGKGKGSLLESSQGTAFGLLNSITEYIDHEKRARNHDYRLDSAWFGQGAQIKQKAMKIALKLIE